MRLLKFQANGRLALTKDLHEDIPPYAILSHTWGKDEEEVTFQDISHGQGTDKPGHRKIELCGKQAVADGYAHFWVDSCCIDKSNSAELSEALNSMFRWYKNAERCYVHLEDVSKGDDDDDDGIMARLAWKGAFRKSRWFTRGWTLQELVAPSVVEFYSAEWQQLGNKESLVQQLHEITGIPVRALQDSPLSEFPTEEVMLWSAGRQTKRGEDMAYCLLGMLDVFLPPIYGEGKKNALVRLREEVAKRRSRDLGKVSTSPGTNQTEIAQHPYAIGSNMQPRTSSQGKKLDVICYKCKIPGHYANEPHCDKCREYGHYANDPHCDECGEYGHSDNDPHCYKCGEYGHYANDPHCDDCDEYGHSDNDPHCYKCGKYGHYPRDNLC